MADREWQMVDSNLSSEKLESKMPSRDSRRLRRVYEKLRVRYDAQNWWRHESKWEIMVGAILTQNTAWQNVDKALANLKRAHALEPHALRSLEPQALSVLIRAAGFTTSKPARLKTLAEFLRREYEDRVENMRGVDLMTLRAQLLALNGIGPETADAILLYAVEKPIFVVDAYTRRIFQRLGICSGAHANENAAYHAWQNLFMDNLPHEVGLFQTYHALLVIHAKETCTKRAPRCGDCVLRRMCARVGVEIGE